MITITMMCDNFKVLFFTILSEKWNNTNCEKDNDLVCDEGTLTSPYYANAQTIMHSRVCRQS